MTTLLLPSVFNITSTPLLNRTKTPLFHRPHSHSFSGSTKHFLRGSLSVTRFGFHPSFLPEPDNAEHVIKELFGRAENLLYTITDAAVSSSDTVAATTTTVKQSNDWLSGITNYMEIVLKVLKDGLSTVHAPYAYGFAIILLTVLVKAATFPLTKKQVESGLAMRSLQPQIKAIQQRYAGDQERLQLETARLYKLSGINPLAGCLPTLATIPVWIGLYRALSNVADEGLLTEGFFWIPSLAGPTTVAARQSGSGISWLFPFVDGQPPLGWSDTLAYLVLPVLLVVSQYISVQIMQSSQPDDPNLKTSQALTKVLPLMIGYFALSVPSGLSLYWLTNNILSTAQQVWLQKLGGAKNPIGKIEDDIMKDDPSQIQKSASKLNSVKTEADRETEEKLISAGPRPGERFRQLKEQEERKKQQLEEEKRRAGQTEEKLISDGPRPGERFRQLKEQEEKKKQQREEEKRRAEEAAAKATKAEGGNQAGGDLVVEKSQVVAADTDPSTSGVVVNGNSLSKSLEENQNPTSTAQTESNEGPALVNVVRINEQTQDKEPREVLTTTTTTNKQHLGEEPNHVRKD